MRKYRVTRIWYTEANNLEDAVQGTKNWKHDDVEAVVVDETGLTESEKSHLKKLRELRKKLDDTFDELDNLKKKMK